MGNASSIHAARAVGPHHRSAPSGRWWSLGLVLAALILAACAKRDTHPLKGVIVDVYPEPPALLVDHENIPGVMAAMTMKFGVDAATVARVHKGQKIEGRMRFQEGKWSLEDVRIISGP